jgi:hypothetical protein
MTLGPGPTVGNMLDLLCRVTPAVHLATSDRTNGVVFLLLIWAAGASWWVVQKRRQSWWWGYSQRLGDNTGERWIRVTEARADKPMPERSVGVVRGQKRRR